jgi:hypothetical protein
LSSSVFIAALIALSVPPLARADIARVNYKRLTTDAPCSCAGTTTRTCVGFDVGTGSDRAIVIGIGLPTTNTITSVTHDPAGTPVAFQHIATVGDAADRVVSLWYLLGPSTGSHDIDIVFSTNPDAFDAYAVALTGVKQSAQPDHINTNTNAGTASPLDASLTTVADQTWIVSVARENAGVAVTWVGVSELGGAGGVHFADSNGVVTPAGGKTVSADTVGANMTAIIAASFAAAPATSTCQGAWMMLGMGKCE